MLMPSMNTQRGVGLVEVLVAMLLLAIGVFGFVALQARATAATTEALKRADALVIMQGLAERMRLNPQGNYQVPAANKNCLTQICKPNDQAQDDLNFFQNQASSQGITLRTMACPQTSIEQPRTCLISSWDKTTNPTTDCLVSGTSQYIDGASCMLLEAY